MEINPLYMYHRCMLCDKAIDKYKFLSRHLNSKMHKQRMEEIERKRKHMKAMNKTDKLRELEETMENVIVSFRVLEI